MSTSPVDHQPLHFFSAELRRGVQVLYQLWLLPLLLVTVLTTGCSKRYSDVPAFSPFPFNDYVNHSVGRFKTSYIVDQIDAYYRGVDPGPIGVTTLVNIDDLYSTSTFGRMFSEQMMSELAIRGFDVIELRHGDALEIFSPEGEFALSRSLSSIRPTRDLGGVVVGTYVASPVRVYVNVRLIEPATSKILSAGSVEMKKTSELARMLRKGGTTATLERIPVRRVGLASYPDYGNEASKQQYDLEERSDYIMNQPTLPLKTPLKAASKARGR